MTRYRLVRGLLLFSAAILAAALVGSLLLRAYGSFRLGAATKRYEQEVGPLDLPSLAKPKLPTLENAATWLRSGAEAIVLVSGAPGENAVPGDLAGKPVEAWTPDETAKIETILERNRPALDLLDRARALRASSWDILYAEGGSAKIPDLLRAMQAGKLLCARARLALHRGDRDTALRSAESLGALSSSLEGERLMITLLIGIAIEKYQLALGHVLASDPSTTREEIDRFVASIPSVELGGALRLAFRCEAAVVAHDLGTGMPGGEAPHWIPRPVVTGITEIMLANGLDGFRALNASLGAPVTVPLDDPDRNEGLTWWGQMMSASMMPNMANGSARVLSSASARDIARLALAVRREAITAGRYPANLPPVPGVPRIDRFSGSPWIYAIDSDGNAEIRSGTTQAILRSIYVPTWISYDTFYRWILPPLPRRAPAGKVLQ